jgi:glycosyltransferase involved in cell wall biosynthesis
MPEDFRWRAQANREGLVACHALVTPTAAFAEMTARVYELPRPLTVHNGRRLPSGEGGPRERQVFTAGRLWDDGKNIAVLDAAAGLIDAPVFAAGPLAGPNGTGVSLASARSLGALPSSEVRAWLARSAVFASAARYEPFGLAVLEAAQAGCALVLSDVPTFRELWHDAAVFVPPDAPEALAAELQALLDSPERTATLGAAAQARACRYTLHAMAEGMLGVYGVLLASRLPRLRSEAAA